jgi:hypothetical protein
MPIIQQFTVGEIYTWYVAGLDLLPDGGNPILLPAPVGDEQFATYIARVGGENILHNGDILFAFLIFKLSSAGGDGRTAVRLLDRAMRNLTQVRIKLLRKFPNGPICPPINHPPSGTNAVIAIQEDSDYIFSASDFGFTDPDDAPPNTFFAVKITTLPAAGTLRFNNVAVVAGDFIPANSISSLVFRPALNANGVNYASFLFQVQDDGFQGLDPDVLARGGSDIDDTPNRITFDVTPVNDAPTGTDKTITLLEDSSYTFKISDFGLTDVNDNPPNNLLLVTILTTAGSGELKLDNSAIVVPQIITANDIVANKFVFVPAANAYGLNYANFTFRVQDDGGTENDGVSISPTVNTLTLDVVSVNDAPTSANRTITVSKTRDYAFTAADFEFADGNDSPPNNFIAVKIVTLPATGLLTHNNVPVVSNQTILAAEIASLKYNAQYETENFAGFTFQLPNNGALTDPLTVTITALPATGTLTLDNVPVAVGDLIPAGDLARLIYTPLETIMNYSHFTFRVQDDGGTESTGADLSATANTITIDVAPDLSP